MAHLRQVRERNNTIRWKICIYQNERDKTSLRKSICTDEDLAKKVLTMAIWRDDMQYDLCPKCRRDFKKFMKNGA